MMYKANASPPDKHVFFCFFFITLYPGCKSRPSLSKMRSSLLFSLAGSAVLSVSAAKYKPSSTAQTDVLAAEALTKLTLHAGLNSKHSACNSKNVARRREW